MKECSQNDKQQKIRRILKHLEMYFIVQHIASATINAYWQKTHSLIKFIKESVMVFSSSRFIIQEVSLRTVELWLNEVDYL